MTHPKIVVLKFGGSVLRNECDLPRAIHEIYRHWRRGSQVLVVVSAFGGATDRLIERSTEYGTDPNPEALAALLLTGEATSAALLGLALDRAGIPVKLLTAEQSGVKTYGQPLDAQPIDVDLRRIKKELRSAVVVIKGFVGTDDRGDLTLLGRGGSDYTALFLAQKLDARCILLKNVNGLHESDPTQHGSSRLFHKASYKTALRCGGEMVQPKAVRFAERLSQQYEIIKLGATSGTLVGEVQDELASNEEKPRRPLRVALLGCGTVGGGVYHRLSDLPELFDVVGVVNLDPNKALKAGIHKDRLAPDAMSLIEGDCDVVVELIGGVTTARSYVEHALEFGRNVVTANKALLAEAGYQLKQLAADAGVTIRYSASVGGALPALEALADRDQTPVSITGIINGTCNFVVDQLASGADFDSAIKQAQEKGFAEADPTLDLDGTDAAQKIVLLARESFGAQLTVSAVDRQGIDTLLPAQVREANGRGNAYRLVAECRQTPNGVEASVKPIELPSSHPFAQTTGAGNCLLIEDALGRRRVIRGRGAGRHATTEAVMADLFDLHELVIGRSTESARGAAA
ncbi:MAG TPA: homoserine dehydrogenase [Pyrinomonadaceae bacterium]|jgi:homoserine dehydrogenase